jgi:hypothetical protein
VRRAKGERKKEGRGAREERQATIGVVENWSRYIWRGEGWTEKSCCLFWKNNDTLLLVSRNTIWLLSHLKLRIKITKGNRIRLMME